MKRWTLATLPLLLLTGCTSLPHGVQPVRDFNAQRYLGKWYEIARLDHSFESGLSHVSATYSLRDDGGIKVINRGYSIAKKKWSQAIGKAYFVHSDHEGYLKVSFFGPFYGTYAIFDLASDYSYSMVAGPNKDYLWILSRTPTLPKETLNRLINEAKSKGFATDQLIMVAQTSKVPAPPTTVAQK
ncbi:lipocalin family protein [Celerinatantimonas diazotrophica]|uniref:Outer membrane lipoprotein Blc n=1 Tax=Celerinatantimonas diazotrophica TaxID=412034 RepID=A0A4R1J952_9GAMM|nr:lipocalin family protein [Celerinatantimonas diazotrophica]TCK47116.1 apolipoprotein D and lipocalin family protein [Celerinatantimonas diazotrophica]CAG9295887.1 Outer membrane lipoprotein Blc [Celerinatantimonas diazotrophica]